MYIHSISHHLFCHSLYPFKLLPTILLNSLMTCQNNRKAWGITHQASFVPYFLLITTSKTVTRHYLQCYNMPRFTRPLYQNSKLSRKSYQFCLIVSRLYAILSAASKSPKREVPRPP